MAYLVLAGIGVCLAVPVWGSRRGVAGWVWLFTGGAISAGDLTVNAIFNLYEYRPGFLQGRADNYLGVVLAECLFVPALYSALSLTDRRWRPWLMALTVPLVTAMELLFLRLRIYFHHGWQLPHTIGLFSGFALAVLAAIVAFERHGYSRPFRVMQVVLSMHYAMNLWGLVPLGILRWFEMRAGLSPVAEWDLIFSSLLLHALPFNAIGLWTVWTRTVLRWWIAAALGGLFALWITWVWAMGWWSSRPPWNPLFCGIGVVLTHRALCLLDCRTERLAPAKM